MSEMKRSDWPWGNVLNFDDEQVERRSIPDVTIREEDSVYEIEVEGSDLEKNDFDLFIENGLLTVSASRQTDPEKKDKKTFRSFSRSFNVPVDTDEERIQAEYVNGILKISIPKINRASKARRTIKIS
ncbi:MAG TPA: Hsp20/alpha crystallin family protein [Ohtaekwangia sp.]